jgi:predicted acylesterase/phospholipase RssA
MEIDMLGDAIGMVSLGVFFRKLADLKMLTEDLAEDLSFVNAARRWVMPIPLVDRERPLRTDVFPPMRDLRVDRLAGKKVGIVATGGSGAMVCAVGVMRACEEAGIDVAAISSCSGSALALGPIAGGLSAQETAEFLLGWRREDYLAPDWAEILKIALPSGTGFTGLVDAEQIERLYERRVGSIRAADLPIPFYVNVWNMDTNEHVYFGTKTTPDMTLPRMVRVAMSLALCVKPCEIEGSRWSDGGVIHIFPVEPLVWHHPEIDFIIGVNGFYPERFAGVDRSGWAKRFLSLFHLSRQVVEAGHMELARMQYRLVEDRCLLLQPVPHRSVEGVKLYEQFLDHRKWPEFMTVGYESARAGFETLGSS